MLHRSNHDPSIDSNHNPNPILRAQTRKLRRPISAPSILFPGVDAAAPAAFAGFGQDREGAGRACFRRSALACLSVHDVRVALSGPVLLTPNAHPFPQQAAHANSRSRSIHSYHQFDRGGRGRPSMDRSIEASGRPGGARKGLERARPTDRTHHTRATEPL